MKEDTVTKFIEASKNLIQTQEQQIKTLNEQLELQQRLIKLLENQIESYEKLTGL